MATVQRDENGQLVLNDPEALEVITAVGKHNCTLTFEANADRVSHFRQRFVDRRDDSKNVVIVIACVDDHNGKQLADALMQEHDWNQYRQRGEIPFARGLAGRQTVQEFLGFFDQQASDKLRGFDGLAVVVIDHGVAEVF